MKPLKVFAAVVFAALVGVTVLGVVFQADPASASPVLCEPDKSQLREIRNDADFRVSLSLFNADTGRSTSTFYDGDLLGVKFKSPKSGCIWVFNADMYGNVRLLYPNKWERDNNIRGGRWYTLGGDGSDFQWRAEADCGGCECVFAIVATDRDDFLNNLSRLCNKTLPRVSSDSDDFLKNRARPFITEESHSCDYGFGYKEVRLKP